MKFLVFLLTALTVSAQTTAPSGPKSIVGEVTSADAGAKQLKLKTDAGAEYTVNVQDTARFVRIPPGEKDLKNATPIALGDINPGDRVLARGAVSESDKTVPATLVVVMTKADVAKKQEADQAEWQKRGLVGTVTAITPDTKEITIQTRGAASKTVIVDTSSAASVRRYADSSVRFSDARPSSVAELRPADSVRVLGEPSDDGSHYKAEQIIFGTFRTIAATVISADGAAGTVRVTDLQTKRPVVVHVTADTMIRRLPEAMAKMMAMRMRGGAAAGGGPAGSGATGGAPGSPATSGAGAGASGGNASRQGGANGGAGAWAGAGAGASGGGAGRGNFDLQRALERMPAITLADLKPGDALIISSGGSDPANMTATALVAGVEPFLAAAPRSAGQINLGDWNLGGGMPEQ